MDPKTVEHLVIPFLSEEPLAPIYLGFCCRRLFAGRDEPKACRTCPKTPKTFKISDLSQVDEAIKSLTSE